MNNVLRPRTLGGILGETFKIIGRNFLKLLTIVAPVGVLLSIIVSITVEARAIILEAPFAAIIYIIGARLLFTVAQAFLAGALIHAVSEQHLRQTVSIGRAYRFAWRRLVVLTAVLILIFLPGLLVTMLSRSNAFFSIGFFLVIYLVVRWTFALQIALLEGLGPIDALSSSSDLVHGNWWRVLGILSVLFMIVLIIFYAASYLTTTPLLVTMILAILAAPISFIGTTLIYYDLRVRKEGYNLESLGGELHIKIDNDSHEKNL